MLELFQFIFSSFWIWLGTLLLISAARGGSFVRIKRVGKSVSKPTWKGKTE